MKGRTLSIFRSSKGYLSAAYASRPWNSEGGRKKDKQAFVMSLTNEMRVFRPMNPSKAVWHFNWRGPTFPFGLGVAGTMNEMNQGCSVTEGHEHDFGRYCVVDDGQGNSILTGEKD
jgi:hypothetical protein